MMYMFLVGHRNGLFGMAEVEPQSYEDAMKIAERFISLWAVTSVQLIPVI